MHVRQTIEADDKKKNFRSRSVNATHNINSDNININNNNNTFKDYSIKIRVLSILAICWLL